ncbi:MAG: hypothetical protein K5669_03145 [Lachnospiraceae bacterium]|nr:hypothetical protein [Lachnospiraceae bacterium]
MITSKAFSTAAFVLGAGLLVFSSVGGTRAALTYYSENYTSRVQLYDIGVTIAENGKAISYRDYVPNSDYVWDQHRGALLLDMVPTGEEVKLGVAYPEVLSITNSGNDENNSINTYNRVVVYKYWVDKDGKKCTDLDPNLIDLHYVNIGTDWIIDQESSTSERTVLYYTKLLKNGQTSPAFSDTVTISDMICTKVTQTAGEKKDENGKTYKTLTTTYDYDGYSFVLEAVVNAIQDHNAEAAAKSVWGREISIAEDGTLSLK